LGVGDGFLFVDDGVGGIEAVGGVVVVAGSEVVEVGGLFAFFVGELGIGGVFDGLAGLDFFAEGAVGGGIDDIAGIVGNDSCGIDLVGGVVEVFVAHGSVFGDQFGAEVDVFAGALAGLVVFRQELAVEGVEERFTCYCFFLLLPLLRHCFLGEAKILLQAGQCAKKLIEI